MTARRTMRNRKTWPRQSPLVGSMNGGRPLPPRTRRAEGRPRKQRPPAPLRARTDLQVTAADCRTEAAARSRWPRRARPTGSLRGSEFGVAFGARLREQFRERLNELLDEVGAAFRRGGARRPDDAAAGDGRHWVGQRAPDGSVRLVD